MLTDPEEDPTAARRAIDAARAEAGRARAEAGRARAEATQARSDATRAEAAAERARAEADKIAASTSYVVGRMIVGTIRRPTRIVHLPREVARAFRRRRGSDRSSRTAPDEAATTERFDVSAAIATARGGERYFLADSAVSIGVRSRPVVLGVLTDATADALEDVAIVDRVTPNDALLALERSEPDLVLVETAAFAPTRPWAYAADPAAVERASVLLQLVERAHGLGRPSVLVRGGRRSDHVGLIPLEPRFDLVLDAAPFGGPGRSWSRGVRLGRFNPVGAAGERDRELLFVTDRYPPSGLVDRAIVDAVLGAARGRGLAIAIDADGPGDADDFPDDLQAAVVGRFGPAGLAARYRRAAVIVADPIRASDDAALVGARTLEQLASGARVVSGPNAALAALDGAAVSVVDDPAHAADVVASALEAGAPAPADLRRLLRTIHLGSAAPVMLAQLTRRLGIVTDPLAGRTTTAIAHLTADTDVAQLVDGVTGQLTRPSRLVVHPADGVAWSDAADEAVRGAGIASSVVAADGPIVATTTWVTAWPTDRPVGAAYLADLLLGGEMSVAEVVGYGSDEPFRYVAAVDPRRAIVRREALAAIGLPGPLATDGNEGGAWLPDTRQSGWRSLSMGEEEQS